MNSLCLRIIDCCFFLTCRLCEKVVFDDFFGDRAVKVEGVIDGYVV